MFPITSRYYGIETAQWIRPDGTVAAYLRRRFVPPPDRFADLQSYTVQQGARLDNIAARFAGDPERFWQLCDANNALDPDELTRTPGRVLRITLPAGIPGAPNG